MANITAVQLLSVAVVLYLCSIIVQRLSSSSKHPPLPPGPKGLPFFGNVKDLPPPGVRDCFHWLPYKDKYGPISSITVLGTPMVLVHDLNIAFALMEKRSANYSSRPYLEFAMRICGWEDFPVSQVYNSRFRLQRKYMHGMMGSTSIVSRYDDLFYKEGRRYLLRTLLEPGQYSKHIRTASAAIILKFAYGYSIEPHAEDPLVEMINDALRGFFDAFEFGRWAVDLLPVLRFLPDWFPGATFKKTGRKYRKYALDAADKPFAFAKQQSEKGIESNSFVSESLKKLQEDPEAERTEGQKAIKFAAAGLYSGGSDTTIGSVQYFYIAMALHPEAQQRGREEIERVIGTNRIPSLKDRRDLPYIEALYKETMRWQTIGPMGLPHVASETDVFEGYTIPKGSLVMPNVWWFLHDPKVYHNPDTFNPDRFLGQNPEPDPAQFVYGFGRRICPGRLFASNFVFLVIAQTCAVFQVTPAKDPKTGAQKSTKVAMEVQGLAFPQPFEVDIRPLDSKREKLIRAVTEEYPWEKSDAKVIESIPSLYDA